MVYPYTVVGELPKEGIYLDQLRRLIFALGGADCMQIALCKVEGGYVLNAYAGQRARKALVLCAEKSKQQRIFKTPAAAFGVCKKLGYSRVTVEI